jgi:hypothetical protein
MQPPNHRYEKPVNNIKTLPDDLDDDPMDFKHEIEKRYPTYINMARYQRCKTNKVYHYPYDD